MVVRTMRLWWVAVGTRSLSCTIYCMHASLSSNLALHLYKLGRCAAWVARARRRGRRIASALGCLVRKNDLRGKNRGGYEGNGGLDDYCGAKSKIVQY